MCYPRGDFLVGDRDVLLGVLDVGTDGVPVWISGPQYQTWKHTQLVIDVVPGPRRRIQPGSARRGCGSCPAAASSPTTNRPMLRAAPVITGADYERGERPSRARSGGDRRRAPVPNVPARSVTAVIVEIVIPLPRPLVVGQRHADRRRGRVAGGRSRSTVAVHARIRPAVAIALVVGIPSAAGLLTILFSGRRWVTMLGAFILALAPGWFGVLVALAGDLPWLTTTPRRARGPSHGCRTSPIPTRTPGRSRGCRISRTPTTPAQRARREATSRETPEAAADRQDADAESAAAPVQPVTVPGRYLYLKWWKLLLVHRSACGPWRPPSGSGLFYWWYHTVDKTAAVFVVLVYVVACAVGGVMLAMVEGGRWSRRCRRGDVGGRSPPWPPRRRCTAIYHCAPGWATASSASIPYLTPGPAAH